MEDTSHQPDQEGQRIEQPHLKKSERRRMVTSLLRSSPAAFVLGAALTAGALHIEDIRPVVEPTPRAAEAQDVNADSPRGKFLNLNLVPFTEPLSGGGSVSGESLEIKFTNEPQVLSVEDYNAIYDKDPDPKALRYEGNIVFRRYTKKPTYAEEMTNAMVFESTDGIKWTDYSAPSYFEPRVMVKPDEVKAKYVVPVFGDAYDTPWAEGTNASFENEDVSYNGVAVNGGVWYALANESGNYVNPQGESLKDGEKPFYTQGFFVNLRENTVPQQPQP